MRRIAWSVLPVALVLTLTGPVCAQQAADGRSPGEPPPVAAQPETSDQPAASPPPASVAPLLGALGNLGGLRDRLRGRGLDFSLTYIGEVLGNVSGGRQRAVSYEGRLDLQADADLGKLAGWTGGALHLNAYQIHGRGLSRFAVGNLMTVSGIEALPATRLYELWFEQTLFDGKLAVRLGQLAADTTFQTSQYAALFVNSTFGWPLSSGANLPSGGPAYPLATPGVQVTVAPTPQLTVVGAAFNGDPAGPGVTDPQRRDRDGLAFRVGDDAFLIGEIRYAYNQGKDSGGLAGTVKLGGWYHSGHFSDQRIAADGLSLLDPTEAGTARSFRGNNGVYAILDQAVYRLPGTDDGGIGVFARVAASPAQQRNLISVYADGGVTFKGLLFGRADDTAGLAVAYARVSDSAQGLDRDARLFQPDMFRPVRTSEVVLEATYQATVVPGWTVQPVAQYVIRPGAGIADVRDGAVRRRVGDAVVLGLRTTIRF